MKRGRGLLGLRVNLYGFTIVEVMIVLAVSSAIFLSAALLIGGKQNTTEFSQAVQQIKSQVQQAINDVASGYYPTNSFDCSGGTGSPQSTPSVSAGSNGQGTNGDVNGGCVFSGKALQFAVGSASSPTINIYPIIDSRLDFKSNPVTSLTAAPGAVLAYSVSPTTPIGLTNYRLEYGLSVYSMCAGSPCSTGGTSIGSVIFGSNLVSGSLGTGDNGVQQVSVYSVDPSSLGAPEGTGINEINTYLSTIGQDYFAGRTTSRTGEVDICFNSGGTRQSALMTIAANGSQSAVQLSIKSGLNCT